MQLMSGLQLKSIRYGHTICAEFPLETNYLKGTRELMSDSQFTSIIHSSSHYWSAKHVCVEYLMRLTCQFMQLLRLLWKIIQMSKFFYDLWRVKCSKMSLCLAARLPLYVTLRFLFLLSVSQLSRPTASSEFDFLSIRKQLLIFSFFSLTRKLLFYRLGKLVWFLGAFEGF